MLICHLSQNNSKKKMKEGKEEKEKHEKENHRNLGLYAFDNHYGYTSDRNNN